MPKNLATCACSKTHQINIGFYNGNKYSSNDWWLIKIVWVENYPLLKNSWLRYWWKHWNTNYTGSVFIDISGIFMQYEFSVNSLLKLHIPNYIKRYFGNYEKSSSQKFFVIIKYLVMYRYLTCHRYISIHNHYYLIEESFTLYVIKSAKSITCLTSSPIPCEPIV